MGGLISFMCQTGPVDSMCRLVCVLLVARCCLENGSKVRHRQFLSTVLIIHFEGSMKSREQSGNNDRSLGFSLSILIQLFKIVSWQVNAIHLQGRFMIANNVVARSMQCNGNQLRRKSHDSIFVTTSFIVGRWLFRSFAQHRSMSCLAPSTRRLERKAEYDDTS